MKKIILSILIFVMNLAGISHTTEPTIAPQNNGAAVQIMNTAPFSSFEEDIHIFSEKVTGLPESTQFLVIANETEVAQYRHYDVIPLTYEEQDCLQAACEEFDIPYALALGLIENESSFRNIAGDGGDSSGYMQIQKKWNLDRMERLGVVDLFEPESNFRVGCDLLAELYKKHKDWSLSLTVYNMGHDPGYITQHALKVMESYARWQETLETYN